MDRTPERELMDDPAQAAAYARADFRASNAWFVDAVVDASRGALRAAVDLGCGPGEVTIALARALPRAVFTAVDGSPPMIAHARAAVREAGLERRITVVEGRIPGTPSDSHRFDAVLSKDLLHHLPDPLLLWHEVTRLGAPGALVCVMDLVRPDTPAAARRIVDAVAAEADAVLRQDFYNSLLAAFTVEEVRRQLEAAGPGLHVEQVSDRHMLISGRVPT